MLFVFSLYSSYKDACLCSPQIVCINIIMKRTLYVEIKGKVTKFSGEYTMSINRRRNITEVVSSKSLMSRKLGRCIPLDKTWL